MSNFEFLRAEWPELFGEAVRAEREGFTDPRISCFYARRTLELAVAWLYAVDATLRPPYNAQIEAGRQRNADLDAELAALQAVVSAAKVANAG